ncbi:hypothetical protein D3C81_1347960 [compost metagenome]
MAFDDGLEQLHDVGERVAARQQVMDQAKAPEMGLRVDADPAAPLGRIDQAAILVRADIAHRGAGRARQFIDRVFGIGRLGAARFGGHGGKF